MHALWSLTRRRILKVLADVSLKGGFVAKTKIPMTRAATLNVHVRQLMVLRVYARETIGEHLKVLMFDNECANRKNLQMPSRTSLHNKAGKLAQTSPQYFTTHSVTGTSRGVWDPTSFDQSEFTARGEI